MKLSDIRLATRLGLSFGLVILLVLAMAGVGGWQLQRIAALNELQKTTTAQVRLVGNWKLQTELNLTRVMVLTKGGNSSTLRDMLSEPIKLTDARITALQDEVAKGLADDAGRALLKAAAQHRKAYAEVREGLQSRLKQGDVAGVEEDADKRLMPAATAYLASIDALAAVVVIVPVPSLLFAIAGERFDKQPLLFHYWPVHPVPAFENRCRQVQGYQTAGEGQPVAKPVCVAVAG